MPSAPTASIVVPTRRRAHYLDITLASVMPQAARAGAEVLVVSDGSDPSTTAVARRHDAELITLERPGGANRARNRGVARARSELIVFIDDDVDAPANWLESLLAGVRATPDYEVFGGPIRARLEGGGPRTCGRESAPITSLDLGPQDRDAPLVWSANMAVRRSAFERAGWFDEMVRGHGDEEDWEHRYLAAGGRIRYLAAAGLEHRRAAPDAALHVLARDAYRHGRAARRTDVRKHAAPPLRRELRTLAGCAWHIARRRCANGLVLMAHATGRVHEEVAERRGARAAESEDFLSGTSGDVWGVRATSGAIMADAVADAAALATLRPARLRRAARGSARRRVLVLAVERTDVPNLLAGARAELERSRHSVEFASTPAAHRGKYENLNALLREHPPDGHDWVLILDDDVSLPRDFLDNFVFLAERFDLRLAQPAHRSRSHAAWEVTRRRLRSVVRETAFVESGPLVAFHAATLETLLPFPPLRAGWGLDAHWSAVARQRGWKIGIVDATPVRHGLRLIATSYDRSAAIAEGRRFLEGKPYVTAVEAQRTLAAHRTWT